MMGKRRSGVDKGDEGEVLSTPKSLGRGFVLRYLEVYEVAEEVALQRSCLAVAGTNGIRSWICPDSPGLERRGVAVIVGR